MPRLNTNPETRNGSPAGGSTLMTSAPSSASSAPAYGPATNVPMSSTRMPLSGPSPGRGGEVHGPAGHDPAAALGVVDLGAHADRADLLVVQPPVPLAERS